MAKDRVTVKFESYDDTEDEDILTPSAISIYAIVDTVSDLYLIDTSSFIETKDIFVFVKNVNASISTRGAFYRYNYGKHNWDFVVIGTHSHENKELLDQLGDIDINNFKGNKKYLSISLNTDNNASYEYKLTWEDMPLGLPTLPETTDNKNLYLSYTKNGQLKWDNKFIPFQTFQIKKVLIVSSNPQDGEALSGNSLTFHDIFYNRDEDTILLFDGHFFLTNFNIDYNETYDESSENNITRTLTLTGDADQFTVGEIITLIVLRNGVSGVLDTIEDEYMTKADVINLLSGGTISLKEYLSKVEANDGYAKKQHTHSHFSQIGHNHDDRYASFYHTHSEYINETRAQELISSNLEEVLSANPEILETLESLNTLFNSEDFNSELADLIRGLDTYTKAEVDAKIITLQTTISNTLMNSFSSVYSARLDGIDDDISDLGRRITDIENGEGVLNHLNTTNNILTSQIINVTGIPGSVINGYNVGSIIPSGTNLTEILTKIFRERVRSTLVVPSLEISTNPTDLNGFSIGSLNTIRFSASFIQNNAGELESLVILYNNSEGNPQEIDFTADGYVDISYFGSHDPFNVSITATYKKGTTFTDNFGEDYFISSGTITKNFIIKSTFLSYIGSSNLSELTENEIESLASFRKISSLSEDIVIPSGKRKFVLAIPWKINNNEEDEYLSDYSFDSLYYKEQGIFLTDLVNHSFITITINDISAYYVVYEYDFPAETIEPIILTCNFKEDD